jgi:oxygen-independent coproporphyrinogen-3 oxidase
LSRFAILPTELDAMFRQAADSFDGMVTVTDKGLSIRPEGRPLTRMIARAFDAYDQTKAQHSAAV